MPKIAMKIANDSFEFIIQNITNFNIPDTVKMTFLMTSFVRHHSVLICSLN